MSGYLRDKNSALMSLRLRISPGMAQDARLYLVLLRRRSLLRWRRMEIGPKERREGSLSASTSTSTPDTSEKPRIVIEFPPAFPSSSATPRGRGPQAASRRVVYLLLVSHVKPFPFPFSLTCGVEAYGEEMMESERED